MRKALGTPRITLSGSGTCKSLIAVPVVLTLLCAAASAAKSPSAAGTNAPTGTSHRANTSAPAKRQRKAKRHAQHSGKTHAATHSGKKTAPRSQTTQRNSTHPGHQAKRRSHRQFVARHGDPSKLIIPEGDGSPILSIAAQYLGRPYHFGAEGDAFDCSGLVRTVFADMGVDLPHSAREIASHGDQVGRDELEPGDLVFFHSGGRHYASHVGIYVGEDKFIHAATRGGQVQVDSLSEAYYAQHYFCARRIET